jgi:predicted ATP-dependent serine protease
VNTAASQKLVAGHLARIFASTQATVPLVEMENERCCGIGQVGSRAERMGLQGAWHIFLYSATRLVDILSEVVAMQPRAVIIDSIQTVYLDDVNGSAGSVSQVPILACHHCVTQGQARADHLSDPDNGQQCG